MSKKRVKLIDNELTLDQGYMYFLNYCKGRNLRSDTINFYDNTINVVYKYIDPKILVKDISLNIVSGFIASISKNVNSVTVNTYSRGLKTILYYFMKCGYLDKYKITIPAGDKKPIETYNDEEIKLLISKPKKADMSYISYRNYVICNLLLSTGIRCKNLINLKKNDVDLENRLLYLRTTKNHKGLVLPIGESLAVILHKYLFSMDPKEYLNVNNEYLFTNDFGEKLKRNTLDSSLRKYNHSRGVYKTGIHRWRHTFSYRYIKAGGNVVILSKLLGHSNLNITQEYINLLMNDLTEEVNKIDILKEFKHEKLHLKK